MPHHDDANNDDKVVDCDVYDEDDNHRKRRKTSRAFINAEHEKYGRRKQGQKDIKEGNGRKHTKLRCK